MNHNIKHLAIIMDGNARWAYKANLTKAEGHIKGAETAKSIMPFIAKSKIPYTTLYAFSSENWNLRPTEETNLLIRLLTEHIENETQLLHKNGIRLKVIGQIDLLDQRLQDKIYKVTESTSKNENTTICIAFCYGGRNEILDACRKIAENNIKDININNFKHYLYDIDMPDVDLLIRTGGEHRISNFLLWQAAYAELYFLDKYWPDFNEEDLKDAIINYSNRKRRFGGR